MSLDITLSFIQFQSTPPARGATMPSLHTAVKLAISIHAPREGGDHTKYYNAIFFCISIHAPREGGDPVEGIFLSRKVEFQSTPPARGATDIPDATAWTVQFQSTPPARGATVIQRMYAGLHQFQSTPPARGATHVEDISSRELEFQSTPPARGATMGGPAGQGQGGISIHAPREGGDAA